MVGWGCDIELQAKVQGAALPSGPDVAAASPTAGAEWRRHWKLVLSAAVGASMASIAIGSLGAFMAPLEQEFGWTRAEVSAGLSIYAVSGIVCSPLLGHFIDRWGPRRFGVPGVILAGLAFALFGTASGSAVQWLGLWLVYSLAAQIPRPLIWTGAVASEFDSGRGLAIAAVIAATSIGGTIAPIIAEHLITEYGWRTAYWLMGLVWGGIAGALCLLFFFGRSDRLRQAPQQDARPVALDGPPMKEGLKSTTFVKLAVAVLLVQTLLVGLLIHMIPLLVESSLTARSAAWIVGLSGIAGIAGQFLSGILVGRFPGHRIAAGFCIVLAASCLLLLIESGSVAARVLPVGLFFLGSGAMVHLFPYLTSRYFGLRAYGVIFGFIASIMAIGVGLGPLLAGFAYDATDSYRPVLIAGVPIAVAASLALLSLGTPRRAESAPG